MTVETLWTSEEAALATKGIVSAPFAAKGVSIDTRTLAKDDLFVALKGENLDGHTYVEAAFKNGAAAALVQKDFIAPENAGPLLYVDDTTHALEGLARAARARSKGKIIAVAGSVGKTGTKEMLATLFGALGKTHASKKSFNNHWGVPLSLSNLPAEADFGIFEVGMNHPGEIVGLTDQVRPHIAIITTIDQEHIEFFENGLEGIADANAEIFQGMDNNSIAVLNRDNHYFSRLIAHAEKQGIRNIIGFGEDDAAEARLVDCALHSDGSQVTAEILGEKIRYRLNIPGKHIVMNSLGALAVVAAAGGDLRKAVTALEKAEPVTGRGNRHHVAINGETPAMIVIDDSYNANPASMQAAFQVLEMYAPSTGGRRIAALGDMLELGKEGPRLHAGLANPLLKAKVDLLFCCGPLMDALYQSIPEDWRGAHEKDSRLLAEKIAASVKPGDIVLVKGSAGSKMGYVVQALQNLQKEKTKDKQHAL
jgi:UDP-N-acetylmuramoyl-tripeptide--D-alanyl-D-alanine ligase